MSALTRDPFGAAAPQPATPAPGWPADPGVAALRWKTGADWDPLAITWPAMLPPAPPPPPPGPPPVPEGAAGPDGLGPFEGSRADAAAGRRRLPPPPPRLTLPPEPRLPRDVAPSRLSYRLNRLWLTPAVRRFVRQGLPGLVLMAALAGFWAGEERRALVLGLAADLRAAVENRPEFRIDRVEVVTRNAEVGAAVLARLDLTLPTSSLRLDLEALRRQAETFDAVAGAEAVVRGGGLLELRLTERTPAMIWRHAGGLDLIDAEGRRVARIASRAVRPDLPLVAGEGVPAAMAEARALLAAAEPLGGRLVGLVRVGERRWDLVLTGDRRILLPPQQPVAALERVLALDAVHDLLSRDIVAIDMRNPQRPTLRLTPEAAAELARLRDPALRPGAGPDTRMARR